MIRILVVDDHEVVREGLKHIFQEHFGDACFGEAASFGSALDLARREDWDVAVLDISLDGRSGLELLKQLRRMRPRLPVLVLSMHSEEQYARRAFRSGAAGYLTKDSPSEEVVEAVRRVASGGRYVSPGLAERLVYELSSGLERAPHETLSDREFEVMHLIASGKTLSEIASELSLSVNTVSTYRARGCSTRCA